MKDSIALIIILLSFFAFSGFHYPMAHAENAMEYDAIIVRSDLPYEWAIAQAYSQRAKIPIIIVEPEKISREAMKMLSGLRDAGAKNVLILGGEKAISNSVALQIEALGLTTHRINEADRYGTSASVARELYPESKIVILVNAEDARNLILAQKLSMLTNAPIIFIKHDSMPKSVESTIEIIRPEKIFLISSPAENISAIESELVSILPTVEIKTIRSYEEIKEYASTRLSSPMSLIIAIIIISLLLLIFLSIIFTKSKSEKITRQLLSEDENKVVEIIKKNKGEILQEELYELTGFSRPKISRIVSELEKKKIIFREKFKKTFKIRIEKDLI